MSISHCGSIELLWCIKALVQLTSSISFCVVNGTCCSKTSILFMIVFLNTFLIIIGLTGWWLSPSFPLQLPFTNFWSSGHLQLPLASGFEPSGHLHAGSVGFCLHMHNGSLGVLLQSTFGHDGSLGVLLLLIWIIRSHI